MVFKGGISLKEAFILGATKSAKTDGLDEARGSLEPGKRADLLVTDEETNLFMTMVGGKIMHETDVIAELSY